MTGVQTCALPISPSAFAAFDISKAGDLTATDFDELGFDTTGLVGYWQLNGNAHDSSGHGNNGTIVGATATTDRFGTANMAMNFNGTSNYVGINYNLARSDSSVAFWVKTSIKNKGVLQWSSNSFGYTMYTDRVFALNASGQIGLYVYNGVGSCGPVTGILEEGPDMADGNAHHIVATWTTSGKKLYVDGVNVGENATGIGTANPTPFLVLGFGYAAGGCYQHSHQYFSGTLDEVKVFNRALTATEILSMYNHEKGKFSVGKDGKAKAVSFVEDPALPVQMRSKKQSLTVKGQLIEQ